MAQKITSGMKHGTSIFPCTCISRYQDKVYGHGHRLHNNCPKYDKYRCTSCGNSRARVVIAPVVATDSSTPTKSGKKAGKKK